MNRTGLVISVFIIISYAARCGCWDPNHVYLYDYSSSIAIGSPTTSTLRMKSQLTVRVINTELLIFKLNDSNLTNTSENEEWSGSTLRHLETEFQVVLKNNTVQSLSHPVRSNVSHWAVGVHKGIASIFSLRYPEPESKEGRLTSSKTYSSMEEEVTGRCANVYEWYALEDDGKAGTKPADKYLCHPTSSSRYQLYKTRDFDNCTRLSMYNILSPAGWRCRPGTAICENAQSRSLVERVKLCGDLTKRKLDILNVEVREDWIGQPWGAKHRQSASGRMSITQRVTLTAKEKARLGKEGPAAVELLHGQEGASAAGTRYEQQSLAYVFQEPESDLALLDDDRVISDFLEDIKELRSITFQPMELVKRKGSNLRIRLFNRFRSLSRLQLESLTKEARLQLTPQQWSFYFQQMATVGSAVTLDIAIQLMEAEQITNEDVMNLISGFTMFLRDPSDHVLGQLLSLLDSKVVRREPDLRQTAMVSLASFFRVACIDRLSAETRFPSQYLNTTRDSARRDTWPRRLVKRIAVEISRGDAGDRSAALSALNILGHPSLIPVVIPLIEGKVDANPAIRTKAVLALHKLAHHGDVGAIKILHTVYANPSENYQVRLAAFTLLMLSSPPIHVWQAVAARTWFEPRQSHVASFVFTTFDTLASLRSPSRFLQKLSLRAKQVLRLTKPVTQGRSANYIWSYEKRRRLLASYLRLETFANKASVFPKEIYGRLNFNLGAIDFDFLEFEIHGHRMESILAHILAQDDGDESPRSNNGECTGRSQKRTPDSIDALLHRLNVSYPSGELGEGFLHWTLMESIEKFWSFDSAAKSIRGYLMESSASSWNVEWLRLLPLVNVEIRWANSMGLVTEIQVKGHVAATLNGTLRYSRKPVIIDSHLNPTLALEIDSSIAIQPSSSGVGGAGSSSSILLLASLPGRLKAQLTELPVYRIDVKWSAESSDETREFILLHKSHCLDGCSVVSESSQQVEMLEWKNMLLGGDVGGGGGGGHPDWEKLLSAVSFSWLPNENMAIGWQQFSWRQSIHPSVFQFSVQLDKAGKPMEWIMKSGTSDLLRAPTLAGGGESRGATGSASRGEEPVTTEKSTSLTNDPADFIVIEIPDQGRDRGGIAWSPASAAAPPPRHHQQQQLSSAWPELSKQIGRVLFNVVSGQEQEQPPEIREPNQQRSRGDHLAVRWKWQWGDDIYSTTGSRDFPMEALRAHYTGECRIGENEITTFDGVVYEPRFVDGCQYVAVAATGPEDKSVVLLDRGSRAQNQVLRLMVSDDSIEIDLANQKLIVNRVPIPLAHSKPWTANDNSSNNNSRSSRNPGGFTLSSCHGDLLYARYVGGGDDKGGDTLQLELPLNGLVLDIHSADEIIIKARESLGGQLQGLCGDMNGERLFEFRGPRRCVLSSGSLMAAQYQTSDRPHCSTFHPIVSSLDGGRSGGANIQPNKEPSSLASSHARLPDDHLNNCPRQEGSPTVIQMPISANAQQDDDL